MRIRLDRKKHPSNVWRALQLIRGLANSSATLYNVHQACQAMRWIDDKYERIDSWRRLSSKRRRTIIMIEQWEHDLPFLDMRGIFLFWVIPEFIWRTAFNVGFSLCSLLSLSPMHHGTQWLLVADINTTNLIPPSQSAIKRVRSANMKIDPGQSRLGSALNHLRGRCCSCEYFYVLLPFNTFGLWKS